MTIAEVLSQFKEMIPCGCDDSVLIRWLSEIERCIALEIVLTHEGAPESAKNFEGYDFLVSRDTKLFADGPFESLYVEYLAMKYYVSVCDIARYNSYAGLFYGSYGNFADSYNRSHKPLKKAAKFKTSGVKN